MSIEVGHFVNFHPGSPAGVTWPAEVLHVYPNGSADLRVTDHNGVEHKKVAVLRREDGDNKDYPEFFTVPSGGVPVEHTEDHSHDPNAPHAHDHPGETG